MYNYLADGGCVDKKAKSKKKCIIQLETKFELSSW